MLLRAAGALPVQLQAGPARHSDGGRGDGGLCHFSACSLRTHLRAGERRPAGEDEVLHGQFGRTVWGTRNNCSRQLTELNFIYFNKVNNFINCRIAAACLRDNTAGTGPV